MPRTRSPSSATLRAGALVTEPELAALAGAALDRAGIRSKDAAERLGVSLSSVSDAVNNPAKALTALRLRILALAGYGAEGPLYRITKE
jgi:hypothetical protein